MRRIFVYLAHVSNPSGFSPDLIASVVDDADRNPGIFRDLPEIRAELSELLFRIRDQNFRTVRLQLRHYFKTHFSGFDVSRHKLNRLAGAFVDTNAAWGQEAAFLPRRNLDEVHGDLMRMNAHCCARLVLGQ
jgi:hypothetical protein